MECVGSVALILNVAVPAIAKEAIDSTIAGNGEPYNMGARTGYRWVRPIYNGRIISNLIIQSRLGCRNRFARITL